MTGISITLIPRSWAVGRKTIRAKVIYAFGPFRLCLHRGLRPWSSV